MVKSSNKVLNPADKARREARKKELKKNKKQRQQVRSAAIESNDPESIISELEKLDQIEYGASEAIEKSISNEILLKEKRKRLNDRWTKILEYYQKEDPERHAKLKKLGTDYEYKRKDELRKFEAIKKAQEVTIDEIFLPPETEASDEVIDDDDPLMSESIYITPLTDGMKPPGCPPGLPPDFNEMVANLKTSLEKPVQILPSNLLHLGLSQLNRDLSRSSKHQKRKRPHLEVKESQSDEREPPQQQTISKAAVIESKPVIFMQKATKFVPASVRSKITQKKA